MTWTETHDRYHIVNDAVAAAAADPTAVLTWKPEYALLFGSPQGLLDALRHRWQLICEAQLDGTETSAARDERYAELRSQHAALVTILEHYSAGMPVPV